jgi:phage-related protein (TIGR01555 family)
MTKPRSARHNSKNTRADKGLAAVGEMFANMVQTSPNLAQWMVKNYGKADAKKVFMRQAAKRANAPADYGPLTGVFDTAAMYTSAPLSMPFQLASDSQYNPITLNRILLSYCYMTFGVIQTVIDQPVEDGLRGGISKIICDELDDDDKKALLRWIDKHQVIQRVKSVMKWAKLFGGSGLIINTAQDPEKEFDREAIRPGVPLSFIDADRWELTYNFSAAQEDVPFTYYTQKIHSSRVMKVNGKEAPSFIRPRLQGWGMSEVDRLIRDANMYSKEQDVLYEMIDEAKQDVFKIQGFNASMLSAIAQGKTAHRLQIMAQLKNHHNAIILDKEDDYDQKEIRFSGLAEVLNQIRVGMAAAARMPMTKLFGLSASGFNAGEDDIENYNAMIESEVRAKAREIITVVLPIACRHLFGFEPEYIDFEQPALRVMSAEQEESIKTSKQNRIMQLYDKRFYTGYEADQAMRQEGLVTIETEISRGKGEIEPERPEDIAMQQQEAAQEHEAEMADKAGKGSAAGKDGKEAKPGKEGKG